MENENKKSSGKLKFFLGGTAIGVVLGNVGMVVLLFGFFVVKTIVTMQDTPSPQEYLGNNEITISEDSIITGDFIKKVIQMENIIQKRFYLHEVDTKELEAGAYRGIVQALDDVYSEYYTPEELEELMSDSDGTYYGIGAYVSIDETTNLPKISGVIKNSPAEAVDLHADDLIYKVGGTATNGMSLTEVVKLIKGPEGTQVEIIVIRDSEEMTFTLTRSKVETPTVETEMMQDGIGYLRLTEFDKISTDQFKEGMKTLRDAGMKGMILDLRSNPGGNLSTVVEIARMMLPKGLIVYTQDTAGKREEYTCNGKNELDIPLVVLIDGNSASASEILAGAIQDYGIGTLVGTTSFGKGIVQGIMPLDDGSAMKLTISAYYTPNGRNIHGTGIEPDVVCEFDSDKYYDSNKEEDNQLEKAIEVLKEKMNQ